MGLSLFGLAMVYSASAILAQKHYNTQFYFLARQSVWMLLGLAAMAMAMRIDYRVYKRPVIVLGLLLASLGLLCAVFFFPEINNTHRWIRYGAFSLQPSEIAKLALVIFLASFLEVRSEKLRRFGGTFVPAGLVAALMMVLVAIEPDLGTALLLGLVFIVVTFAAGVPGRHLATLAIPMAPALAGMLLFVPWRLQRVLDFLDPWQNATTTGFQISQSLIAVGSGGATGVGFAQGKQKLFYLPAPHTDFIFAVIGEELGLIGAGLLVMVFAALAWRGFRAARRSPDSFGQSLALGITVMIAAQAFFNVSVALSLVPTKGIPLPFVSCGGSSLAINLLAAGILLNISKHASETWH
jgi:cell division protein FtsW